jgi:uncharacterized protein (TIGR03546 family)
VIELIANIFKVLNSETEPRQISLAACLAMIAGLTPLARPHNLLVLLLVLLLRVNLSAFIIAWGLFSGIAYLLDPLFHRIGIAILQADALNGIWTALYNQPYLLLTRFNNTVTMGSLVVALLLFGPLFVVLNLLIRKYREQILVWIQKTRVMQMLKATKIYQTYQSLRGWGGVS